MHLMQLATGGSAITAIEVLKEAGVAEENILFLNVVSCPEGLRALAEKTPGTTAVPPRFDPSTREFTTMHSTRCHKRMDRQ